MAATARLAGFEREKSLGDTVGFRYLVLHGKGPGPGTHQGRVEQVANTLPALGGMKVPGESQQIAPVAIRVEQSEKCRFVGRRRGVSKAIQPP